MNKLQVGDVILGTPGWAFGRGGSRNVIVGDSFDHRYVVVGGNGKKLKSYDCYDPTRVGAKYVVVRTAMEGGGTGHGPHDIFPDGWNVQAQRLAGDGSFDATGEIVEFYQSGCFNCMSFPEMVGKMKMMFVPV